MLSRRARASSFVASDRFACNIEKRERRAIPRRTRRCGSGHATCRSFDLRKNCVAWWIRRRKHGKQAGVRERWSAQSVRNVVLAWPRVRSAAISAGRLRNRKFSRARARTILLRRRGSEMTYRSLPRSPTSSSAIDVGGIIRPVQDFAATAALDCRTLSARADRRRVQPIQGRRRRPPRLPDDLLSATTTVGRRRVRTVPVRSRGTLPYSSDWR